MNKLIGNILIGIAVGMTLSCNGFLDEKPEKSILVPNSVDDVRYILDNYKILNENPLLCFILADDYQTVDQSWEGLNPWVQRSYLWQDEIFAPDERSTDYNLLHRKIFYANVALKTLADLGNVDQEVQELKGEALFVRSMSLFYLAQLFLPHPQSSQVESTEIPVHFNPDVNAEPDWVGSKELMERIVMDLEEASLLLSQKAAYPNRPDRLASKGLLSRVYLYMGDFEMAYKAGKEVIGDNSSLLNYADFSAGSPYPFPLFNKETVYYGFTSSYFVTASAMTFIDPELVGLYSENDRRKELFFRDSPSGRPLFRGSYTGVSSLFTGITLSEIYLNVAEAAIRTEMEEEGLGLLTLLATNRYKDVDKWKGEAGGNLLEVVLEERRKELVFRCTRWGDMKRLAAQSELEFPITRVIRNEEYKLEEMEKFTLNLPEYELELEAN
ncbi:RagB/SusD family nutrient uptake outer membrane protein [Algoriphagus halophytocola]|uniref:RagB/SusD family nutrient uptake outer membrane protein n=1 Tax=Algoriphagus halophytocola TaxID=2991499 RepID=UPI0022DE43BA|nr:RagB/SusD family nutrient uptake outer membrane protein [Algoriphagus sp. TR-M9]WBL43024.1 RagB/SusD family nutrient uptake outer membrane protein [Algoriphagus sp. TR-M9]